jgi:hypothetical protein
VGAGLGEGPEPHLHRFDGQNGGLQLQLSVHQPSVTSGEMWWQTFLLLLTLLVFRCCSTSFVGSAWLPPATNMNKRTTPAMFCRGSFDFPETLVQPATWVAQSEIGYARNT